MDIFLCGFGYPGTGVLKYLVERGEQVAVFTHDELPNAPSLTDSALHLGCWSTTDTVNDTRVWPFMPEMIISVYYRHIFKSFLVDDFRDRLFNCHPSLLPRHRGCSSIPWAIIEGDSHSGVTYHWIDESIDTGKIILQVPCQIEPDETQLSLQEKINTLVVDNFHIAYWLACAGYRGRVQQGTANYNHRGVPYNLQIDPTWPTPKIERFIRAMIYPPYKPAQFGGQDIHSIEEYYQVLYQLQ